jgi:hypothetical protein
MRKTERIAGVVFAAGLMLTAVHARGQATDGAGLPESPSVQTPKAHKDVPLPIAGDSLYAPIALGNELQSLKLKTESYLIVTFGPRALVAPAFSAGFKMAFPPSGYPREWRDGGPAFGRNYGAALGSKVALESGRYAAGALLHEDFRYRPATGKGVARLVHAIGYTFVDSSDSGHRTLAVANFAGAAAGGFAGNFYLPDGYNSPGDGAVRFGTRMAGFAGANVAREYSPEIYRVVQALHLPFPRIPVREWWTKGWSVSRQ